MARHKRESTEILNRNKVSRREFLQIAGAAAGLTLLPRVAAANARVIRAEPALAMLVGGAYPQTAVWTYGGTVPGTELRFKQGERLRVELENLLREDTTVHWHGVRLPNAMDGVPHVTQAPIAAKGGRFLYEFDLRDAGTYWYHPHLGSPGQVGRGLYAPLIVEEPEPPAVDRDVLWMLGDWRLDR
ncbi:MAG: copper oxidase, partial [Acidobacteria bacterium]